MYDLALMEAASKAKLQQQRKDKSARYRESNREALRQKKAEYDRQHTPQKRQKQAEYDSQHRPEKRQKQAEYYRQHTPQKREKQAEYDSQHRQEKRQKQAEYDSQHKQEKKAKDAASLAFSKKNQSMAGRLKEFRNSQRDGLSYPCASCCRLRFKTSVVDVTSSRCKMSLESLEALKINESHKLPSTYLCGTCKKYLKSA